mgnify:CR=1 FL=1
MKDYLPFSLIPLLILFLCIPSIQLCSPFSHVFTLHACLPFIFTTFVVHVQTPVLHLSPSRLPSMFKLPFGPLSAPTCPPCLHFLPSMLSSVSPPFCHPPFQPTYSTFALDTNLYFLSFIFLLHLTISSFIFQSSFQLVPLQLYSPCYSSCQVHFHKYSACLVRFYKCQLDNFDDTSSRNERYSTCLVYIHKCQLDKFFSM